MSSYFLPISRYEKALLIGTRASQIANGSTPLTDIGKLTDPLEIALKEFNEGKIPLLINRNYKNKVVSFKIQPT